MVQNSLFETASKQLQISDLAEFSAEENLNVFAANVQNPGAERVSRIIGYIEKKDPALLILTELTDKDATNHLIEGLNALGFVGTGLDTGEAVNYQTLIFSRRAFKPLVVQTESLRGRVSIIRLNDFKNKTQLYIVGAYGVAFNEKNKLAHKKFFDDLLARVLRRLASPMAKVILAGDLNVVEQPFHDHIPDFVASSEFFFTGLGEMGFFDAVRSAFPAKAMYTWYSPRNGEGQRLDHIFTLGEESDLVSKVAVDNDFRNQKLSDHSALQFEISLL